MAQVISFEERAVATLRDRLGAAESAKQDLIAFARGHSGATHAIHLAVLELMHADSLDALFSAVTGKWPAILGLDEVSLALVADGKGFRVHSSGVGTVEPKIVDRAIERIDPVTMRTVDCGHPLFGERARDIRSEALVVIENDAPLRHLELSHALHSGGTVRNLGKEGTAAPPLGCGGSGSRPRAA